ncbi:DUF1737 domain-containing protein [Candidatus Dojkabacteria bacterium]|jgi:hypothetical protein|nr:DUF1737 domain-containing protein [Candidatus Dojkabacteria bacterium]
MEYKIVFGTPTKVEQQVQKMLNEGWELHGGPMSYHGVDANYMVEKGFVQAMIRIPALEVPPKPVPNLKGTLYREDNLPTVDGPIDMPIFTGPLSNIPPKPVSNEKIEELKIKVLESLNRQNEAPSSNQHTFSLKGTGKPMTDEAFEKMKEEVDKIRKEKEEDDNDTTDYYKGVIEKSSEGYIDVIMPTTDEEKEEFKKQLDKLYQLYETRHETQKCPHDSTIDWRDDVRECAQCGVILTDDRCPHNNTNVLSTGPTLLETLRETTEYVNKVQKKARTRLRELERIKKIETAPGDSPGQPPCPHDDATFNRTCDETTLHGSETCNDCGTVLPPENEVKDEI